MLVLLLLLREDDARNVCLLSVTEKTRKNGENVIIPRSSRCGTCCWCDGIKEEGRKERAEGQSSREDDGKIKLTTYKYQKIYVLP